MDVISVVIVGSIVTYFMYQNINKVTQNLEKNSSSSYKLYANFSRKIQEYIKDVKKSLDDDFEYENSKYIKNDKCDSKKVTKELADLIRKLSYYETMLAKNKTSHEIEASLVQILSEFEQSVRNNCVDGDRLADELKILMQRDYKNIIHK